MVFSLKLSLDKKAIVIFAFAVRLPVIAAAIVRLHYLSTQLFSSDPALEGGVLAQVFTQIEISYAIITTTTPCLRPFMSALNTNYGGPATPSPGGTKYGAGGYNLSDMSKNSSRGGGGQRASSRMSALLSIGSNGHSHNASIGQAVSAYGTGDAGHNSRTGGHKAKGSVAQSSVRSNHIDGASPQTRWDDQEYSVAVHAGDHHSTGSHESTKQIINRNTEWHVEHGRGHANAWA